MEVRHFRATAELPYSWYSARVTHLAKNSGWLEQIEAPFQVIKSGLQSTIKTPYGGQSMLNLLFRCYYLYSTVLRCKWAKFLFSGSYWSAASRMTFKQHTYSRSWNPGNCELPPITNTLWYKNGCRTAGLASIACTIVSAIPDWSSPVIARQCLIANWARHLTMSRTNIWWPE